MKLSKILFTALVFFLLPSYANSASLGELRISLIDGDVQIKTEDADEWIPAAVNTPLIGGDRIWVPDGGRLELQMRDGTYVRLDEKSSLEILTIERDSYQFYLTRGRAYVNFRGLKDSVLQIDGPVSSVRAYDKSTFRIDVEDDGYTNISVFKGVLYAETRGGRTNVHAGKTLSLRGDTYAELSSLGPVDEWERWNRERDRKLSERMYSSNYLPDELDGYSYEFDNYGKWVYVRDYGYCWTPTVYVSAGWSPYRSGRWVWRGGDYVWISYEPWGWVPYHYGRWAFIGSVGWCWVPPALGAVYWGPGFVGWVYTDDYVSWVPLAPGEIYYGYGYFGPHSVNIINVNINTIVVKKVFVNAYARDAVVIVHRDTFLTGRPVNIVVKENPFLKERIHIGRPLIKPERATYHPVIREISRAKQPPRAISEIRVRELKEKRPMVRERSVSVMRPEAPQRTLPVKPREVKPTERGAERPREVRPAEKGIEKERGPRPTERGIEKGKEPGPAERETIRKKEGRPAEKKIEKRKEIQPLEREDEKPKELKPTDKGRERRGETRQIERETERPRESKPAAKGTERRIESPPVEKGIEKERGVRKGADTLPKSDRAKPAPKPQKPKPQKEEDEEERMKEDRPGDRPGRR